MNRTSYEHNMHEHYAVWCDEVCCHDYNTQRVGTTAWWNVAGEEPKFMMTDA